MPPDTEFAISLVERILELAYAPPKHGNFIAVRVHRIDSRLKGLACYYEVRSDIPNR